jgi:hypothetical protein
MAAGVRAAVSGAAGRGSLGDAQAVVMTITAMPSAVLFLTTR